jgi:hypothetical protein
LYFSFSLTFRFLDWVNVCIFTIVLQSTIVYELRNGDPKQGIAAYVPELRCVSTRSRAMVTCYPWCGPAGGSGPGGDSNTSGGTIGRGYVKHCDNAVGNGRKLTAILYLNVGWRNEYGGQLCIYPNNVSPENGEKIFGYKQGMPTMQIRSIQENNSGTDTAATSIEIEIAPILNRLVLFWSDMRCPHKVSDTNALIQCVLVGSTFGSI